MQEPIAFVEEKQFQPDDFSQLLHHSAKANRWTNFGPVWRLLKRHIEETLELSTDRSAIPCASGTHALLAAAALAERDGTKRWITSSYGFRATVIGPYSRAQTIDCDEFGLIDFAGLADRQDYDAIVAVNPFGLLCDMNDIVSFAKHAGKALVVDNAAGFRGFDRTEHHGTYECLSFHHTKPYGFGEGGCLIVDRNLEDDAIAAMDFGYRWNWAYGQNALSNGKLSEPAAALILTRQRSETDWAPQYREQFWRIADIGERLGFRLLVERNRVGAGAYGSVPLICKRPVAEPTLKNEKLTLQKYYKPLGSGSNSRSIYKHIVNFPSHKDVASLSDSEIEEILSMIEQKS